MTKLFRICLHGVLNLLFFRKIPDNLLFKKLLKFLAPGFLHLSAAVVVLFPVFDSPVIRAGARQAAEGAKAAPRDASLGLVSASCVIPSRPERLGRGRGVGAVAVSSDRTLAACYCSSFHTLTAPQIQPHFQAA